MNMDWTPEQIADWLADEWMPGTGLAEDLPEDLRKQFGGTETT